MTGTIPSQGAQTITPGTSAKTIAAGRYLSGQQTVAGDANLVSGNIKKGISIFGVSGSLETGNFYCKKLVSDADFSGRIPEESIYVNFVPSMAAVIRTCKHRYSQYGTAKGLGVKVIIPTGGTSSIGRNYTDNYYSCKNSESIVGYSIPDTLVPINIYMNAQNKHVWLGTGDNNNGDLISPVIFNNGNNNNVWLVIM